MEHLDNITGTNQTGRFANRPVKHLTASSILGDKIFNSANEQLGEIKDIMLNIVDGSISYIVIESGGFLGMGHKYFAVPFDALHLDADRKAFILDQSKISLENLPGFDKDHWPETNAHKKNYTLSSGGFMGANTGSEY
jgi:sporulation protein YlmC with PRC-barrel domain